VKGVGLVGAALLSVAVLAGGCGSSHNATALPGLTPAKLGRLKAIVSTAAKGNGDAHPSSVMVFATGRHEANIAGGAGSGIPGNAPVYLVIVRGQFVCKGCSSPAVPTSSGRSWHPRGNVMMMVLDRNTLQSLDGGIGGQVDTSKVGPGLQLRLGRA
jgi:hypothetical protein